jgi:hypothetical protein
MRWRDVVREAAPTEPVAAIKPLTPAAARKRAKKQDTINQQIQNAQGINALRVTGLRAKLGDTRCALTEPTR